ncbi:MAG: hypothetical protein M3R66_05545 [Actinomycetota bacterium]|nr:hypothetical protein [Actinomycetota bacterium]
MTTEDRGYGQRSAHPTSPRGRDAHQQPACRDRYRGYDTESARRADAVYGLLGRRRDQPPGLRLRGWDLATATGQPYDPAEEVVQAAIAGVEPMLDMGRDGGWYGAEVKVQDSAPALHRLLAMTGRDPAWTPGAAS